MTKWFDSSQVRYLQREISMPIGLMILFLAFSQASFAQSPYPQSTVISGINWDLNTRTQAAPGSDLWPTTWGADGHIFTSWGDGGGFGGSNSSGRVSMGFARLKGLPPDYSGENINGGVNSVYASSFPSKGKTAGIISVGGTIYSWVNMQNGSPPDTRLAWSSNLGKTWKISSWKFPDPAGTKFMPSTFVNYGQDNSDAVDDYIYSYGGRWIFTQGPENNAYLIRVEKNKIQSRSSWQFFSGFDADHNPVWSPDFRDAQPAFSDPNGVGNAGLVSVVYNKPLGRYILTAAHRAHQASENDLPAYGTLSNLGVFDSATPWGPWTTVAYYEDWLGYGDDDEALAFSFPAKWISTDGQTMWLVFSGYPSADCFNLIKATLRLNRSDQNINNK